MSDTLAAFATSVEDQHRLRAVYLDPDDLLRLLQPPAHGLRYRRVTGSALPEGCQVARSGYDLKRDQFVVILRHSSFPVCHPGCEVPRLDLECELVDPAKRAQVVLLSDADGLRDALTNALEALNGAGVSR